jgi:hypothetical protein
VGRIILSFFLTSILTGIMVGALNLGADALGFTSSPFPGLPSDIPSKTVLSLITTALGGILFGPISAIALVLEYFDQRVRQESFDIQQLKALMAAPEQLAPEAYAGPIE